MKATKATQKRFAGAGRLLRIAVRLKDQVQKADPGPSWQDRLRAAITDSNRSEGIIRAVKIAQAAGAMDADEASGLIVPAAEAIAEDHFAKDAELLRISEAIETASKAHGLKDREYWPAGEAPDDVEALNAEWNRRAEAILAAVLRKYGETGTADLLLTDPTAFYDRINIEWKKSETTVPDK